MIKNRPFYHVPNATVPLCSSRALGLISASVRCMVGPDPGTWNLGKKNANSLAAVS